MCIRDSNRIPQIVMSKLTKARRSSEPSDIVVVNDTIKTNPSPQKISAMLESLMTTLSPQSAVIIAITSPAFITATVKNSLVIAVSPLADRLHSDTMGIMAQKGS